MESSDWIAVIAILSGAGVSIASLWFGERQRRRNRQQDRADERTERALNVYLEAQSLFARMDPEHEHWESAWTDSSKDDRELINHALDETEWLSVMGWTPGIRARAERVHDALFMAKASHVLLADPLPDDDDDVATLRKTLEKAVRVGRQDVQDLRVEIKGAIE